MKNNFLGIIAICTLLCGCTNNAEQKQETKESNNNIQSASDMLTELPAAFAGVVASQIADSVKFFLTLQPGQNYMLKQTFYALTKGKQDSTDFDNGTWTISEENIVTLSSLEHNNELYKMRIVSADEVALLDSTGREMMNAGAYSLYKTEPDSSEVQ